MTTDQPYCPCSAICEYKKIVEKVKQYLTNMNRSPSKLALREIVGD